MVIIDRCAGPAGFFLDSLDLIKVNKSCQQVADDAKCRKFAVSFHHWTVVAWCSLAETFQHQPSRETLCSTLRSHGRRIIAYASLSVCVTGPRLLGLWRKVRRIISSLRFFLLLFFFFKGEVSWRTNFSLLGEE